MTYNYKCDNINTVIKKIQKRGEKEMVRFKIVATGKNVVTGKDADVTVEYTVTNNELEFIFGKALYGVESQGFEFTTAEIYNEVIPTFDLKLKNTYQKTFSKEMPFGKLEVSLKAV